MYSNAPKIENVDKYWFDNNALLTHFMSALSVLFKHGEGFFMQSLTGYIKDYPEFRQDIIQFCQEERMHSVKHSQLNTILDDGVLLDLEQRTHEIILKYTRLMTKKQRLIVTLCLEHITAIMADELLERTDLQYRMKSDAKALWIYHAQEETADSHRTIAERIFKKTGTSKLYMKAMMPFITVILIKIIFEFWIEIVRNDKEQLNVVYTIDAINLLFGLNGYVTNMIPQYLKFYFN